MEVTFLKLFEVRVLDLDFENSTIIMNTDDAEELHVALGNHVRVKVDKREAIANVSLSRSLVARGEIGVCGSLVKLLGVSGGEQAVLEIVTSHPALEHVRKKMRGEELNYNEVSSIIQSIVKGELSSAEIAAFVLAQHFKGMSDREIEALTVSMAESGERLHFKEKTYDKHSVGGVPGNKVSLLIVPIVAASGLLIPKTSSKAITSPSGTADTMEVLAPVIFTVEEFKEIVERVRGAIVWGGGLNIAPVDDIIIRVEHPLMIDPLPQMIASILAKKLAVGVDNMVLDIPIGRGCKAQSKADAEELAAKFIKIGGKLGINVQCGITYGGQPVGYTVGPALEAREALEALMGGGPMSLVEKAVSLSGILLEMSGKAEVGQGQVIAKDILRSGKALIKMKEIIDAQGGNPHIKPDDVPIGEYVAVVKAENDGYVVDVDNEAVKLIARAAGAPTDKGAGIVLRFKRGYKVSKGDALLEIHSGSEYRLSKAVELASSLIPVRVEGMLLGRVLGDGAL
ncbi:MAG: AMP phosphorylase [Candidatus Jordarchaeales archaeon]